MPFAFLYDNHPGPGLVLMLVCAVLFFGAIFPNSLSKEMDFPWLARLYMGMAGLLGWGPALFGKGGALLYPVLFVGASAVVFGGLFWPLRQSDKSDSGRLGFVDTVTSSGLLAAGAQAFLQLLALHSVATASVPLFWLWVVPLTLAAMMAIWFTANWALFMRPFIAVGFIHGLLVVLALGYLGRIGVVSHYGVPVPGSFWEAPEYKTEALTKVQPYGDSGQTGPSFRARIGIKVGSNSESYEDGEGNERRYYSRAGKVLWIEIAGIRRPIVEQEGTLYMESVNDSVRVYDNLGKSYLIADKLDFAGARKR